MLLLSINQFLIIQGGIFMKKIEVDFKLLVSDGSMTSFITDGLYEEFVVIFLFLLWKLLLPHRLLATYIMM